MSRSVSVKISYTPDDSLRVANWIKNQSFLYRHDVWITAVVVFCVFIASIVFMADDLSELNVLGATLFSAIPAVIMGIVVFVLHKLLNPWLMGRAVVKYFRLAPASQEETKIAISDDGVQFENALASSQTKWPAVAKCVESDSDILLYVGSLLNWFIPKSALASDGDLVLLRKILSDALNKNAILK